MRNPLLNQLSFNYLWSHPSAGNDVLVRAALSRPIFDDLVILAAELGPEALQRGWDEIENDGWEHDAARDMSSRYIRIIKGAHERVMRALRPTTSSHPRFG